MNKNTGYCPYIGPLSCIYNTIFIICNAILSCFNLYTILYISICIAIKQNLSYYFLYGKLFLVAFYLILVNLPLTYDMVRRIINK